MDGREDRIAENETVFREANEQLRAEWAQLDRQPRDEVLFVCECGDMNCQQVMRLTLAEYEAVRADSSTFAVVNGHDDPASEQVVTDTVVARNERFAVVRKRIALRKITDETDPRDPHHGG